MSTAMSQHTAMSVRAAQVEPFHVMAILARARELEAQGCNIIHLEVGESDFSTLPAILDAGGQALAAGLTHYTPASGLPALRRAIAAWYQCRFACEVSPERVIVTPGASGALQLALLLLHDAGDSVLLPDPGYPCNANIARLLSIDVRAVPVGADSGFQLSAEHIAANWQASTRSAMVASPSNPAGTRIGRPVMQGLLEAVAARGGRLIVDEIYQGLVYGAADETALSLSDQCFVINSFSKYFGMTGWRLGWMVVPEGYAEAAGRMAQNLFLAPSTVAQHAALVALQTDIGIELDARRDIFRQRRDFLLPRLEALGFSVPCRPDGAFYVYADCSAFTDDSEAWCHALLETAGVAITPGRDFGRHRAEKYCRFAYTRPREQLEQACERIAAFIAA